jgi:RNA polymerase sigma-70 factor (ECF subfamily)
MSLVALASPLLRSAVMWGEGPTAARPSARLDGDEGAAGSSRDEASLVTAVAAGDREALGALYDLHAPVLMGLARRMLGTPAAAEDLLHDLFLEVWQHAAEYSPARGSVRAWLIVRARSRALDRLGKQGRETRVFERVSTEADVAVAVAPGVAGAIDGAQLRRRLTDLEAELRAVLELAYFEGLSSSEMAERLGIPVGTVKSRVARALGALREAMGARP